ncbi:hypothetical protein JHN56_03130 [Streptomyces sp. MBT60]|nr:hypothetical protein [Streptomyces sp. MBT60]MBK3542071.1 hypothetical protein [Streptomyces sp. MBT60]
MRRASIPCASQTASRSSNAWTPPATTVLEGPLSAAIPAFPFVPSAASSSPWVASAPSGTETMPPLPATECRALLRRATIRHASSRVSTPATCAAAISPCEWPTTAAGRTPAASHIRASDTITANSAGWTTSTRSRSSPRSTSDSRQSTYGSRARSHASTLRRNGSELSISSRPIPRHCDPWPGKTNTGPAEPWRASPLSTVGDR